VATNDSSRDAELARQYWLAQPTETFRLGAGDLARQIKRLQSDARNANIQMYVGSFFNIVVWVALAGVLSGSIARVGALAAAAGWTFGVVQFSRERRRTIAACAAMADKPVAAFYRAALERERSLFLGTRFWLRYAAMVVGPLLFAIGVVVDDRSALIPALIVGGTITAIYSLAIRLRHRQASAYQRQIDNIPLYSEEQQ
jgi:hypothetical protein